MVGPPGHAFTQHRRDSHPCECVGVCLCRPCRALLRLTCQCGLSVPSTHLASWRRWLAGLGWCRLERVGAINMLRQAGWCGNQGTLTVTAASMPSGWCTGCSSTTTTIVVCALLLSPAAGASVAAALWIPSGAAAMLRHWQLSRAAAADLGEQLRAICAGTWPDWQVALWPELLAAPGMPVLRLVASLSTPLP